MTQTHKTLPLWQVLICGALIVSVAMGIRHGFGLWMQPMTQTMGWGREDFAMAIEKSSRPHDMAWVMG